MIVGHFQLDIIVLQAVWELFGWLIEVVVAIWAVAFIALYLTRKQEAKESSTRHFENQEDNGVGILLGTR